MTASAQAGLVMVWSGDRPVWQLFDIPTNVTWEHALVLGRAQTPHDDRVSTKHFGVMRRIGGVFDSDDFLLEDFKSRNGTYVNRAAVRSQKTTRDRSVIRSGRTVWVALFDISPVRDGTWVGFDDDPVRMDELPVILVDVVRGIAPELAIHASAIELCLLSRFDDRAHFVAAVTDATKRAQGDGGDKLRDKHFANLAPRVRAKPFAEVFEQELGAPPPFAIPGHYEVFATQDVNLYPHETIIGSPGSRPLLVQAEVGNIRDVPVGWFMAGFWGHGVNSYAVYYGRRTETARVFLRLPYGAGAYERNKELARERALAQMRRTEQLLRTLDVRELVLVQAMDGGRYRIVCHDGRVLTSPNEVFYYWTDVDFEALVRG